MGYGQNIGFFIDNSLMTVLLLTVRVLWIVFIGAIVAGLVVEAKRRGWDKLWLCFGQQLSNYSHPKTDLCTVCGNKVASRWQYCPSCGAPIKSESFAQDIKEVSESEKSEDFIDENLTVEDIQTQSSEPEVSLPKVEKRNYEHIESNTKKPQETSRKNSGQKSRKRKNMKNEKADSML